VGPITNLPVEKLLLTLLTFANAESIEIAHSISHENFSLRDESRRVLAAYIGGTTVDVNLGERIIAQNQAWSRSSARTS